MRAQHSSVRFVHWAEGLGLGPKRAQHSKRAQSTEIWTVALSTVWYEIQDAQDDNREIEPIPSLGEVRVAPPEETQRQKLAQALKHEYPREYLAQQVKHVPLHWVAHPGFWCVERIDEAKLHRVEEDDKHHSSVPPFPLDRSDQKLSEAVVQGQQEEAAGRVKFSVSC